MNSSSLQPLSPDTPTGYPSRSIFSLPTELVIEITAAGQEGRVPGISSPEVFKSEWTMSHVCHRFRDVIIGAPSLWTLVEANFSFEGSVQILGLYLERSQSCNIWAMCEFSQEARVGSEDHLAAERLSHILPHTQRIYRLGLTATLSSIVPMLAAFRDAAVPALEHLEIQFAHRVLYYAGPLDLFSFGPPLALTFLKITGFMRYPLPQWTNSVTHLEFWRSADAEDEDGNIAFISFTAECPALIHLRVDAGEWTSAEGMDRIVIPSLESLHISARDCEDASQLLSILGRFDTPALVRLTIDYAHGDWVCVLFDPMSLPDSTFPALTSLSFVGNKLSQCEGPASIPPFFQAIPPLRLFPALSSLTLIDGCFTAHIVEQIFGPTSDPWPLLETVTVCPIEGTLQDVYQTLQRVIRSKRQRAQILPKFHFSAILYNQSYWNEHGVDVELFDPTAMVAALA
ncbi:hypothetical protein B0H17DRAFT_10310 [Mycena rosella]|uniref:F-box domain-containing protein n=1 Tax=Mycena rosella TaxID=1033263 RepID=A0AAD7GSR6_MYCRO|nr:hypothetical protein B0H17DRAFT_10310 [Mycena rosella]